MKNEIKTLKKVALALADLDHRILEVFIHSDSPKNPFQSEEIYLVCHLAEPGMTYDSRVYNDEGFNWGLDMAEKMEPMLDELGISQEVIISPFNFELHEHNEYGDYYQTLYLKDGYQPILEVADREKKDKERRVMEGLDLESERDPEGEPGGD
jgi:hypothetical protein